MNLGLFIYPLLMAADILALGADLVPVGGDQSQHLYIARDVATAFNARVGPVLVVPQVHIQQRAHTVVGTDGRKMRKSYGNTIPVLASPDVLRKAVMSIRTDSLAVEAFKDPDRDIVFQLFQLVAPPDEADQLRQRNLNGGLGYGQARQLLLEVLIETFAQARRRFADLIANPDELTRVLDDGTQQARDHAADTLARGRNGLGIRAVRVTRQPSE